MTYTLYYSPGAASMAVHWMLIEAQIPFETRLVDIDTGAQHSAEYLRLNPAGRLPHLYCGRRASTARQRRVLSVLKPDEATHIDELVEGWGADLSSSEIFVVLFELELTGKIRQLPGKNL